MKRKQTPRTDLIGSIILNLGCIVLLVNAMQRGLDATYLVLMAVFTGAVIFKTLGAVLKFKHMTGHFPNLKYDDLIKPKGD